jgi:hypothetical protein
VGVVLAEQGEDGRRPTGIRTVVEGQGHHPLFGLHADDCTLAH